MFLSNDGSIFAYIIRSYARKNSNNLLIYKKGELVNQIDLNKLILKKSDSKRNFEFYNNSAIRVFPEDTRGYYGDGPEDTTSNMRRFFYKKDADSTLIIADKYPTFIHSDTLYLISNNLDLISIDLQSGSINKKNYLENNNYIKNIASANLILSKEYCYIEQLLIIPDDNIIGDSIAKILKMKYEDSRSDIFKYDYFYISGYIYKNGFFKIYELKNKTPLSDSNLKYIVENIKLNTYEIPEYTDRWYVKSVFLFRDLNDSIAMKGREIEKELIASKDTLNGFYIPKDIYDAMPRIDSLLEVKDREEYKNLKDRFEIYKYHHTLGMALRNRWGLWQGSRLYKYFKDRGINHPDGMSGVMLDAYWYYLNDSTFRYPFSNNINYKLDINIFFQFKKNSIFDSSSIFNNSAKIIIKDTLGKKVLFSAFKNSALLYHQMYESDSSYSNFVKLNTDYSANEFLDSLTNYYDKQKIYDISDNSIILLKLYWDDLLDFFDEIKVKRNADTNNYWDINGYKIFYNVSKNEIDSLDMLFYESYKTILNNYSEKLMDDEEIRRNNILFNFFKNKKSENIYIIRYIPYMKFDFKEFKKRMNLNKK